MTVPPAPPPPSNLTSEPLPGTPPPQSRPPQEEPTTSRQEPPRPSARTSSKRARHPPPRRKRRLPLWIAVIGWIITAGLAALAILRVVAWDDLEALAALNAGTAVLYLPAWVVALVHPRISSMNRVN